MLCSDLDLAGASLYRLHRKLDLPARLQDKLPPVLLTAGSTASGQSGRPARHRVPAARRETARDRPREPKWRAASPAGVQPNSTKVCSSIRCSHSTELVFVAAIEPRLPRPTRLQQFVRREDQRLQGPTAAELLRHNRIVQPTAQLSRPGRLNTRRLELSPRSVRCTCIDCRTFPSSQDGAREAPACQLLQCSRGFDTTVWSTSKSQHARACCCMQLV